MLKTALNSLRSDTNVLDAVGATILSLVFKVGGALASFVLSWIIARRFGAEGSGLFAIANTIMTIGVMVCLAGLDYSSVRAVSAAYAEMKWSSLLGWTSTAWIIVVVIGSLLSIAAWSGSELLASNLSNSALLGPSIAIMCLCIVPSAAVRLISSYLRGIKQVAVSNMLDPFLVPALATLIAALYYNSEFIRFIAVYPIAVCISAVVAAYFWQRALAPIQSPRGHFVFWLALKRSLPIQGSVLGGFATGWITTLSLGFSTTEAETGIFRVAQQFALLLGFIATATEIGMAPQFAAMYAQNTLHFILRAARVMSILTLLVGGLGGLILFLFSEPLLTAFGPEFVSGSTALRIFAVGTAISLCFGPVGSLMVMTGLERLSLVNSAFGLVLVSILSWLLIPRYGAEGAALAIVVTLNARLVFATCCVWYKRGILLPLGILRRPSARDMPGSQ